jgi:hypothetical protein
VIAAAGGIPVYRRWVHIVFAVLYALLLFFGVGPVLLADGSADERRNTMAIIVLIAIILISCHRWLSRRARQSGGRSRS